MLHLSSWETDEAKNLWIIPRRMNEFKTVLAPLPTSFHWGEACSAETHSSEVIPGWVTITPSKRQKVLWVQGSWESIWIRLVGPGLLPTALLRAVLIHMSIGKWRSVQRSNGKARPSMLPWEHRSWVGCSTLVFSKLRLVKAFFEAVRFQVGGS